MPKYFEKLAALVPFLQIAAGGWLFIQVLFSHSRISLIGIVFVVYLFPLLIWRLFSLFYPIKIGTQYIGLRESSGSSWIVSYYCQFLFNTFGFLEKLFICIPGLYSFWLRLWGSKIGKSIVWTPSIMIVDRTHLTIDDYAFIGSLVYISNHTIRRKNGRLLLFFKGVHVGSRVILGYGSVLGPGANIPDSLEVRALSYCFQSKIQEGGQWKV